MSLNTRCAECGHRKGVHDVWLFLGWGKCGVYSCGCLEYEKPEKLPEQALTDAVQEVLDDI